MLSGPVAGVGGDLSASPSGRSAGPARRPARPACPAPPATSTGAPLML